MEKIFKKTIIVLFLSIFVFGISIPFKTQAQTAENPIVISAEPTNIKVGGKSKITARIYTQKNSGSLEVTFHPGNVAATIGGMFSSKTCSAEIKPPSETFCSVDFSFFSASGTGGEIPIGASVLIDETEYFSENIIINVESTNDPILIGQGGGGGADDTNYFPLAGLPGLPQGEAFDTSAGCAFGRYLAIVFRIIIGISAVLTMVMIVYGGIEYMTSGSISEKQNGKETIMNAILGLLIALGAWLLLNTLNPKLLNVCLDLPDVKIEIGGDENSAPFVPLDKNKLTDLGFYCPGTTNPGKEREELEKIAKSFLNKKVVYSNDRRNTISDGTLYLDCSSFVKQVYKCAGLDFNGNITANMFPGTTTIVKIEGNKVNGEELQIGNLLGWVNGESRKYNGGHVIMYIGNGQSIEVRKSTSPVTLRPWNYYGENLKHLIKKP